MIACVWKFRVFVVLDKQWSRSMKRLCSLLITPNFDSLPVYSMMEMCAGSSRVGSGLDPGLLLLFRLG